MEVNNHYDILIIGAGAAGLMAANELCKAGKKVAIIEARDRIGGRVHTVENPDFSLPAELGAEFIHGHLPITLGLLKEANIPYYQTAGNILRVVNGHIKQSDYFFEHYEALLQKLYQLNQDISVADFLQTYLTEEHFTTTRTSLKSYVEGYDAADIHWASAFALRDELSSSDEVQYRIKGGYQQLIRYLHNSCKPRLCSFFLSNKVTHIRWQENKVIVATNQKQYTAAKAIITVPLGVLQADSESANYISFTPAITEKITAAKNLGFGNVIKILLQFNDCFWIKDGKQQMSFLFSDKEVPTWWTQYPQDIPLLTGWLAGSKAAQLKQTSEEEMLQKAMASLGSIFQMSVQQLQQKLRGYYIANWVTNPYCCGGYSYHTVNGLSFRQILKKPVGNTLFFAGEALCNGPEIGTVEAALHSGKEVAAQLLAGFA